MGDLIWSLATINALAGSQKVDLATSGYCMPLMPLLTDQGIIQNAFILDDWKVKFDAPVSPAIPPRVPAHYDNVYHMGMRDWPHPTLVEYYPHQMMQQYGIAVKPDFNKPWLTPVGDRPLKHDILITFSDEWAELKAGWINALMTAFPTEKFLLAANTDSRLYREFRFPFKNLNMVKCGVPGLAILMEDAKLVITCNSVGHPLASGLGIPAVVAECSPPRQQSVFKAPITRNQYFDGINAYELVDYVRGALA